MQYIMITKYLTLKWASLKMPPYTVIIICIEINNSYKIKTVIMTWAVRYFGKHGHSMYTSFSVTF